MNLVPVFLSAALTLGVAAQSPSIRPLSVRSGPSPFAYTNAPDAMPNYLAGEKWGTQGNALTRMQLPLSPAASQERLSLPPGFRAELFAAEPEITKPIALAWDTRGRLWIAETLDYPNQLKPAGQGRDRIKVCEDTDGDGRADRFTVFADRLSIPTSLCFARGGVIVIESGHTLFLRDTNGAGHALYTARSFPSEYWNRIAFVAEPTGHLISSEKPKSKFCYESGQQFIFI